MMKTEERCSDVAKPSEDGGEGEKEGRAGEPTDLQGTAGW